MKQVGYQYAVKTQNRKKFWSRFKKGMLLLATGVVIIVFDYIGRAVFKWYDGRMLVLSIPVLFCGYIYVLSALWVRFQGVYVGVVLQFLHLMVFVYVIVERYIMAKQSRFGFKDGFIAGIGLMLLVFASFIVFSLPGLLLVVAGLEKMDRERTIF